MEREGKGYKAGKRKRGCEGRRINEGIRIRYRVKGIGKEQ